MSRLTLQSIRHAYSADLARAGQFALRGLDHSFEDGGAYALLGPSGCGKTTLLNILSGLVAPSEGRVLFDGTDVTDRSPEARNIAQVFQFPVIYDTMTVRENLAFPLRNRRVARGEIDRRVADMLHRLGLTDKADRKARGLTADEKQKISLGRGLVRSDVAAILFDEPLTVIDPHMKWVLRGELKALHRRFGHTMVYVTHDQTEALTFADRVVVMHEGEVVQIGTPEDLFERPEHIFVGYFIGSPGMNVLSCRLGGDRIEIAGGSVETARRYERSTAEGERLQLGVRPEFVRVHPRVEGGLPIHVERVEDIGSNRILRGRLGPDPIVAVLDDGAPVPAEASVRFDPAAVHLFRDGRLVRGEAAQ